MCWIRDEEIENLVRIFVYADRVRRVQRVMEVDCISEERAKKRIQEIENERKNYYKYFTGNDWKNMKNYDLPTIRPASDWTRRRS